MLNIEALHGTLLTAVREMTAILVAEKLIKDPSVAEEMRKRSPQ